MRSSRRAAVAVAPGFLRSEAVLDHVGVTEATWRDAIAQDIMRHAGRTLHAGALAAEYGIDDVDGQRPDWVAYFATLEL